MKNNQNKGQYITKIVKLDSKFEMIKFQLCLYRFIKSLPLSDAEINTISYVIEKGFYRGIFSDIVKLKYFKASQAARNCIGKAERLGILLDKNNKWRVNPSTDISCNNYVLLDLKVHNLEPQE